MRRRRYRLPGLSIPAAVGGLLALIAGTYGAIGFVAFMNRPLGPELETPASQIEIAEPAGPPMCGGPAVMYLLVVGSDATTSQYDDGFADVIRIARIDFVSPSATLLSIPRDLWVQIPGLEIHGIVENRVKSAYAYGNLYDVPGDGPSLLARTLAAEFDLPVDHYAVVSFDAFEAGIDAIGGIDIDVPQPVESTFQSVHDFQAGLQHMDGAMALEYARIREESTDLYRIDRQTQVIMAIREKALSPQILPALPRLVETVRGSVLTDLSPAEISSLVCIGEKIGPDAIHTLKIDSSMVTPTATALGPPCCREVLLPDYEAIAQLVQKFQAGNAQQGPADAPVTQVETTGGT